MKKEPRLRSIATYVPKPGYETIRGKSMTLPDQSLTIQEILTRFSRGLPIGVGKEPIWNEDDPDFDDDDMTRTPGFDIVDAENFINEIELKKPRKKAENKPDEKEEKKIDT